MLVMSLYEDFSRRRERVIVRGILNNGKDGIELFICQEVV